MTIVSWRTTRPDPDPPCPRAGALQYWTGPPRRRMREILDDGKRHQCQKLKTRRNLLLFLKAAFADPVADQVIE